MNQEQGMLETFAVGYQEAEGEQTLLQILPLFLEAGQITIAETLVKKLPSSPMKSFQVRVKIFRWVCFMKQRERQIGQYQAIRQFSVNFLITHQL